MVERDRLIELIKQEPSRHSEDIADHLLKNGVIVPMCKVGDTVYVKGVSVKVSDIRIDNEITYCVQIDCNECCVCPFYEDVVSWEGEHDCVTNGYLEFTADDIGKTVFLTREDAEKTLKEREENGK